MAPTREGSRSVDGHLDSDEHVGRSLFPQRPHGGVDRVEGDRVGRRLPPPGHGRNLRSDHGHVDGSEHGGRPVGARRPHRGVDGVQDDRLGRRGPRPTQHGRGLRSDHGHVDGGEHGRRSVRALPPHGGVDGVQDDRLERRLPLREYGRHLRSGNGHLDRAEHGWRPVRARPPHCGVDGVQDDRLGRLPRRDAEHGQESSDPTTDMWTAASTVGAPSARYTHTAAWTGSKMIVWGGFSGAYVNTGGNLRPRDEHLDGAEQARRSFRARLPHGGVDGVQDDRLGRLRRIYSLNTGLDPRPGRRRDDDCALVLSQPLDGRRLGDVHGDGERVVGDADGHGHVHGRCYDAGNGCAHRRNGNARHIEPELRRALRESRLRRRRELFPEHVARTDADGEGHDLDDAHVFAEPVPGG